jgi:hypothetical protein
MPNVMTEMGMRINDAVAEASFKNIAEYCAPKI